MNPVQPSSFLTLRGVTLGTGAPKICVPVLGRCKAEVHVSAEAALLSHPDVVEWRVDWLGARIPEETGEILADLRAMFPDTPLLATFRTKNEGGEYALSPEEYEALLTALITSGEIDLVDIELFTGDDTVQRLLACARAHGVAAVVSNHDFHATPSQEELLRRLQRMQALGCDVAKIAVMPTSPQDVLTLLSATNQMKQRFPALPLITMSMGQLGMSSRLCGGIFGSALTFGSAGQSSAPGQADAVLLRRILELLYPQN